MTQKRQKEDRRHRQRKQKETATTHTEKRNINTQKGQWPSQRTENNETTWTREQRRRYKHIHDHENVSGSVSCFDIVFALAYVSVSDDVCLRVCICVVSRVCLTSSPSTHITCSKEPNCHVTNWACTCTENGDVAHSRQSSCLFLFFFFFSLALAM